ncbi:MAG: DUF951 domain-containing protein [Armatimonadota bacterium]|nr:DUF951 family protein [Armatimonadota bacterium]MDW8104965.1 DUF951 domain-containing protein [Armatimonadota bacterium]
MPVPSVREGDLVILRKPHACGANCWLVVQLGADVRLLCTHCRRRVLMPRDEFDRRMRRRWQGEEHEPMGN